MDGPAVYRRAELDAPEERTLADGSAVVFTTRSPDKSTPNEDAAALIPVDEKSGVLVVADGLGGERSGDEASSLAVDTLAKTISASSPHENGTSLRTAILDAIEQANQAIRDLGRGAATTIAVLEITDGQVRPYHVGDSMILVAGGRGKIKLQTVSHSPVGMAVEAGLLGAEEAMHHDERHIVSNVVGSNAMRIEIGPAIRLAPRDTVLLASDGLFDNLHVEEIVDLIRKGPLHTAIAEISRAAHERMLTRMEDAPQKPDDLTIIGFRPRWSAQPRMNRKRNTPRAAQPAVA